MISISLIGIILLTGASWLLGVITYVNNPRQATNRIFAGLCLAAGVYGSANYLADDDPTRALFWVRLTFFMAVILVYAMLAFVARFPGTVIRPRYLWLVLPITLAVALVTWLPGFVPGIVAHDRRSDVISGPLYPVFLIYFSVMFIATLVTIGVGYNRSSHQDRLRARLVFYSLIITTTLTALTNLFLPLLQGSNQWADLGSYFSLIFIGLSAYAIVRQRLFDIRVVAARGITYALLIATMAALYVGAFYGLTDLVVVGRGASATQTAISAALAVSLALTFQPLRGLIERLTDRIFYRKRYDTQEVLARFSTVLVRELNLDRLTKRALRRLCEDLDIDFGQLIIFRGDRVSRMEHYGPLPKRLLLAPHLKLLNKAIITVDELDVGERKVLLESHGLRLSAQLRTHEGIVGYLLLGGKLSGDVYTRQDLNVIGIMVKELAVAVSNAQAYAEIQDFAATLQDRVNHATGRLRVANRHLKELDRVKDEFISMASHQLRTPLTTIKGYLSMILEGDAGRLTGTQREFIGYAFTGSERMVRLISDLLDVSRLSAGRFVIQPKPTDLGLLIREEVRQLSGRADAKGLALNLVLPEAPLPLLQLDETKTRQVVMNLIDNAIYYTNQGSVTVVVMIKGGNIRFEVRDTGIGVPEAAKKHLFTKFFRADNAQNIRPDGTGLGVYLAKRVVEDQGGTMIFSSSEGKGSTFGFELPLVAAAPISLTSETHA